MREPCDQPHGVREYTARDLAGQEWFFATPLASEGSEPKGKPANELSERAATSAAKPEKKAAKKR